MDMQDSSWSASSVRSAEDEKDEESDSHWGSASYDDDDDDDDEQDVSLWSAYIDVANNDDPLLPLLDRARMALRVLAGEQNNWITLRYSGRPWKLMTMFEQLWSLGGPDAQQACWEYMDHMIQSDIGMPLRRATQRQEANGPSTTAQVERYCWRQTLLFVLAILAGCDFGDTRFRGLQKVASDARICELVPRFMINASWGETPKWALEMFGRLPLGKRTGKSMWALDELSCHQY